MKKSIPICIAIALIVVAACNKHKNPEATGGTFYLDLPAQTDEYFSKASVGIDEAEQLNRIATLGRVLFYDTRLSVNNAVSCGSCHKQAAGFADNVQFSRGFEGRLTSRNSPGFNGLNEFSPLFWDARENSLTDLIARPISNHVEMGVEDLSALPAKLNDVSYYQPLFERAYGRKTINLDQISEAIATFVSAVGFVPMGKPMAGGSEEGLTATQLYGKKLFDTRYNCGQCHIGGNTNGYGGNQGRMEDIGLDAVYTDKGHGAITGRAEDMGRFKVPNLTNVALTAPYMHDGRFATLEEVLDHYSHGINNTPNLAMALRENLMDPTSAPRKMNISEDDKKAIIAFLHTLNDNTAITATKFSNPFKVK